MSIDFEEETRKISQKLLLSTEGYIKDKRFNFQNIILLEGTILGFSIGLTPTTGGTTNGFLIVSWVAQIFTILIGSLYLILEAESRYFREINAHSIYFDIVTSIKENPELRENDINSIFKKGVADMYNEDGSNLKEKLFKMFVISISRVEATFYLLFLSSLTLLLFNILL